jgi:MFS family permease
VLIIGLSFANINVSLNTIFSKIIGPRRQGTQQGLLQVSGGIGRMLGPITASILYSLYGPVVVWTFVIFVIALNILLWVVYYEKMVPLEMPPNLSSVD